MYLNSPGLASSAPLFIIVFADSSSSRGCRPLPSSQNAPHFAFVFAGILSGEFM
jgi:hypothetical protein